MTAGMPAAPGEAQRRADLKRWKGIALAMLVAAAAIFLGCSWWQAQGTAPQWVGFVRAGAEAGMVGGLADWFAVTALFRRPLGLPIPHTALIPNNKDRVGESLSHFVEENFLTPDALSAKVTEAQLPQWAAKQLVTPGVAERVAQAVGTRLAGVVEDIDEDEAAAFIRTQVLEKVAQPQWAPPLGRLLEGYIAEGKARPLEDDVIAWGYERILGMEHTVVQAIDERMPGWAPRFARDMVGDKVYRELVNFAAEVREDGNHEARLALRRALVKLAQDLQTDPVLQDKVEAIKAEMLDSRQAQQAPYAMWGTVSGTVVEQLRDPQSFLQEMMASKAREFGQRLLSDAELMATANDYVDRGARYAVEKFAPDVISIIPETIKRWDATEASENIELMVGKDLQFIRLNGTFVGALAGIAIYTVNHLIF